jgi:hypothetical protein
LGDLLIGLATSLVGNIGLGAPWPPAISPYGSPWFGSGGYPSPYIGGPGYGGYGSSSCGRYSSYTSGGYGGNCYSSCGYSSRGDYDHGGHHGRSYSSGDHGRGFSNRGDRGHGNGGYRGNGRGIAEQNDVAYRPAGSAIWRSKK